MKNNNFFLIMIMLCFIGGNTVDNFYYKMAFFTMSIVYSMLFFVYGNKK